MTRADTCKNGHPWTPETVLTDRNGWHRCHICKRVVGRASAPRVYVQAPLLALVRDLSHSDVGRRFAARYGMTDANGKRTVQRMLAEPALTLREADRLAVALGFHISQVWPEYLEDAG